MINAVSVIHPVKETHDTDEVARAQITPATSMQKSATSESTQTHTFVMPVPQDEARPSETNDESGVSVEVIKGTEVQSNLDPGDLSVMVTSPVRLAANVLDPWARPEGAAAGIVGQSGYQISTLPEEN